MKIIIETLLVIACALLWMIVLPLAGLLKAGQTIFDEWHAFMAQHAFALHGREHRI